MAASGTTALEALVALPCRGPDLFSRYDPWLSRKAPPRLSGGVPPAAAAAGGPPVVVRGEGTSVLVRELERAHLKGKAGPGGTKRVAGAGRGRGGRKQPRGAAQAHVAPQPGEAEGGGGAVGAPAQQPQQLAGGSGG